MHFGRRNLRSCLGAKGAFPPRMHEFWDRGCPPQKTEVARYEKHKNALGWAGVAALLIPVGSAMAAGGEEDKISQPAQTSSPKSNVPKPAPMTDAQKKEAKRMDAENYKTSTPKMDPSRCRAAAEISLSGRFPFESVRGSSTGLGGFDLPRRRGAFSCP